MCLKRLSLWFGSFLGKLRSSSISIFFMLIYFFVCLLVLCLSVWAYACFDARSQFSPSTVQNPEDPSEGSKLSSKRLYLLKCPEVSIVFRDQICPSFNFAVLSNAVEKTLFSWEQALLLLYFFPSLLLVYLLLPPMWFLFLDSRIK